MADESSAAPLVSLSQVELRDGPGASCGKEWDVPHLVVLHHGLWGVPRDMEACASALRDFPEYNYHVLNCTSNARSNSYDGIEVCAARMVAELRAFLGTFTAETEAVHVQPKLRLSIIGYSLGGLICRYAIGLMAQQGLLDSAFVPVDYISISTPHLGIRRTGTSRFGTLWNALTANCGFVAGGRSVDELALNDDVAAPLLLRMSLPSSLAMQALARFPNRVVLASVWSDYTARFCSPSLRKENPYRVCDRKTVDAAVAKGHEGVKFIAACQPAPTATSTFTSHLPRFCLADVPPRSTRRSHLPWWCHPRLLLLPLLLPVIIVVLPVIVLVLSLSYIVYSCKRRCSDRDRDKTEAEAKVGLEAEAAAGLATVVPVPADVASSTQRDILPHLDALGFARVDVWFPGPQSAHGRIIARNPCLYRDGYHVVQFLVASVLKRDR